MALSHSLTLSLSLSADVLSDILNFVLAKKFQQHIKEEQEVTKRQCRVSQQDITQQVLKNCFMLLHALAYKNELVSYKPIVGYFAFLALCCDQKYRASLFRYGQKTKWRLQCKY